MPTTTPRPSWTGTIRFGLLDIPVKLIPATDDSESSVFVTLHAACQSPVRQDRICKKCANTLDAHEIVKGVDVGAGVYAIVSDEELAALAQPSRSVVLLNQYCDVTAISLFAPEKTYYVVPGDDRGPGGYDLLRRALETLEKAGIGKISFRSRERICAVRAGEDCLVLHVLRMFVGEVRPAPEVTSGPIEDSELALAVKLIQSSKSSATGACDLSRYEDVYSKRLESLVASKRPKKAPGAGLTVAGTLAASVKRAKRTLS
jgi:DNA end-binding protein Ku